MNGMKSLLFISVLMNTSGVVAMKPKRNSPKTAKAASASKSRGTRARMNSATESNSISLQNTSARRAVGVIGLNKPNKFENYIKLIHAIKSVQIGMVLDLLHNEVDVNYCDAENNTPLLCAIFMSNQGDRAQKKLNYKIVQKLLENKAAVKPRHNNPMQVAQLMGNKQIIQLLLSYGAHMHTCTHTIEIDPDEKDQVHNYMGSVRTIRQNWQCECGVCAYELQGEHFEDHSLIAQGIFEVGLGYTPEQVTEFERKQDEEKQKRILARRAQNNIFIIKDQRGYYREIDEPTQKFNALMKLY